MCGRYTLKTDPKVLAMDFNVAAAAMNSETIGNLDSPIVPITQMSGTALNPNFNVAPTHEVPAVCKRDGVNTLAVFSWGLVPHWAKDRAIGNRMINARVETVLEKPSFRTAVNKRRCIVPADGWYEWQKTGTHKQPYFFSAADESVLGFAGMYEHWSAPDGTSLWSLTIMTTQARAELAHIHDRMPVLVTPELRNEWLSDGPAPIAAVLDAAHSTPWLQVWPVSSAVGNVRNNHEHLTDQIEV